MHPTPRPHLTAPRSDGDTWATPAFYREADGWQPVAAPLDAFAPPAARRLALQAPAGELSGTAAPAAAVANVAPVADDDVYAMRPNQTLSIAAPGILDGDTDPDGDALRVTSVNITGLQGSLTPRGDGSFDFTPTAGFSGTTTYTYAVTDGFGGFDTGLVTLNVVNRAPVADDDVFTLRPNQTLNIAAPGILDGDTDPDGDALRVTSVNITGLQGSLTPRGDGSFDFTPTAGFSGTTTYTYAVTDGFGGFDTGLVTLNVVNRAPVADDDVFTLRPNQTLNIAAPGILDGDTDPDGDALRVTVVNVSGLQGSLTPRVDGSFDFTPTAGFTGTTTYTYTVTDGFGGFDTGLVTLNVVNRAPVADDDVFTLRPNQTLNIAAPGILDGDTDPDGDALRVTVVNVSGLQGSLTPRVDGSFDFTPTAGFTGTTTYTYTVTDGFGGFDTGLVTLNVVNRAPVADDDVFTLRPNQTLNIAAPGILDGDTDPDGDALRVTVVNVSGLQGSLTPRVDGSFDFTPTAGFSGTTTYTYTVTDGFGGFDTGLVTLNVVNRAPVADDDVFTLRPNQTLNIAAPGILDGDTDPDGDALRVTVVNVSGLQGSLTPRVDGSFDFTPTAGFTGTTTYTYTVTDGFGGFDTGLVTLDVVNRAPVADDDVFTLRPNQTLNIAAPGILDGDTDPDGDALRVTSVNITGLQGSLTPRVDGSFDFTPTAGFTGTTTYTYTVTDGFGGFDTGLVTLRVVANTAPTAANDSYATAFNTTLRVDAVAGLLANDRDADADRLVVASAGSPAKGTVTVQADGSLVYTPFAGLSGRDSFSYVVSDGVGGTATGSVTVDVAGRTLRIGDAPLRESGTGGQYASAWTSPDVTITHKADASSAAEPWSAVSLRALSPTTLAGGDIYNGDLGVSGQSAATSTIRQEIDGREAVRFVLSQEATGATLKLANLFINDDGGLLVEAGRVRLIDSQGLVVGEQAFRANSATGSQTVTVAPGVAFSALEVSAGAYNGGNFVFGGYATSGGGFGSGITVDAAGKSHGSDFLLDGVELSFAALASAMAASAPLMGIPQLQDDPWQMV